MLWLLPEMANPAETVQAALQNIENEDEFEEFEVEGENLSYTHNRMSADAIDGSLCSRHACAPQNGMSPRRTQRTPACGNKTGTTTTSTTTLLRD